MKKTILLLTTVLCLTKAFSQEGRVGINTSTPAATLDVTASASDLTRTDGFIAPRLTGDELKAKDALYTATQTGAIVYATSSANPVTSKTVNVTEAGYYYFDGSVWQILNAATEWMTQGTTEDAKRDKSGRIYRKGWVGITSSSDNTYNYIPKAALSVVRDNTLEGQDDNIEIYSYGTTGNPNISAYAMWGTPANPQHLGNGALMMRLTGSTLMPVGNRTRKVGIDMNADGAHSDTSVPTLMSFYTTPLNGLDPVIRMIIRNSGNVGINITNPLAKLHVVKDTADLTPAIIVGCNVYADNTAATAAGLPVGGLYRTSTGQLMVRY